MNTKRKHLDDYSHIYRQMEVADAAMQLMERIGTTESSTAIRVLKRGQHRLLKKLDAAAEKLGAPYPQGKQP